MQVSKKYISGKDRCPRTHCVLTRYFIKKQKKIQTCFPFIRGCQCVKLCSFNDPCGETAVAAASSNKKEQQRRERMLTENGENGCYEHSTFDIFNTHAHKVEDM